MPLPSPSKLRALLVGLVLVLVLAFTRRTGAEEVAIPVRLQADLLVKVAGYDRRLPYRAGEKVRVLILTNANDPNSGNVAGQMAGALQAVPDIAGLPHEEVIARYTDPESLAGTVRAGRVSIVYLTTGFRDEVGAIAQALAGVSVLSVGALADYVPRGAVLGFDVVSGKPKLVINITQARRQDVAFPAEILKMAKVIE